MENNNNNAGNNNNNTGCVGTFSAICYAIGAIAALIYVIIQFFN